MSKTLIDYYRGWTIYFDTEDGKFFVMSENYNRQESRGSFAAVKKWVDDFLKDNADFKPFDIQYWNGSEPGRVEKVIGIRKDGRPATEDADGNKGQISSYASSNYILVDPSNDPVFDEIKAFDRETERLEAERSIARGSLIAKLKLVQLDDHLNTIRQ